MQETTASHGSATVKVRVQMVDRQAGGFVAVVRSYDPDPDTSNNIFPGATFTPYGLLALGNPQDLHAAWDSLNRTANGSGDDLKLGVHGRFVVENKGKKSTKPISVRFYIQDGPQLGRRVGGATAGSPDS